MVLVAPSGTIDHRVAATAAASIYLRYEGSVVEASLSESTGLTDVDGVAVVAVDHGMIEWFPHDDQRLDDLAPAARRLAGTGWTVGVVVPAGRMGEAHRALRGAPAMLQPWWVDGETLRFGGPEVP